MPRSPYKRLEDLSLVQREQLAYIDFQLYFFGEIGRPDLIERFGVAPAGVIRDLALYREITPQNIEFDYSNKVYRIGKTFSPIFEHATQRVLTALALGFGDGVNVESQQLLPCESPAALSIPKMDVLATICRAIYAKRLIAICYDSIAAESLSGLSLPLRWLTQDYAGTSGLSTVRSVSSAASLSPASKRRRSSMSNPRPTSTRKTTPSGLG